jgi:hypothetical protein
MSDKVVDEKTDADIKERTHREYESSVLPVLPIAASENKDVLLSLYGEICNSWRMLTDVRFKLLGLVPTVSAVVLISLLSHSKENEGLSPPSRIAISIFGFLITIGICIYDRRNTKLYDDSIARGKRIEIELGTDMGQFFDSIKPTPNWENHRNAINLIYIVAACGWVFVPVAIWQGWI